MDIIKDIIGENGTEILSALTENGFDSAQANNFLGEAGSSIMSALSSGNVSLDDNDTTQNAESIIGNINIAELASKVGINSDLATNGLNSIVPVILKLAQEKFGGIQGVMGMLSNSGEAMGMLGKVKSFFS